MRFDGWICGLGHPDAQVRRVVANVTAAADVVGLTIADYIARRVMRLQQLVRGFPLLT
jgi:hypothetical protein